MVIVVTSDRGETVATVWWQRIVVTVATVVSVVHVVPGLTVVTMQTL
jgi:hypothetical protein